MVRLTPLNQRPTVVPKTPSSAAARADNRRATAARRYCRLRVVIDPATPSPPPPVAILPLPSPTPYHRPRSPATDELPLEMPAAEILRPFRSSPRCV